MTFIRTKRLGVNKIEYLYEVRSYRDPTTGKVRQEHIKYLGKAGKEEEKKTNAAA